jgi:hypothetical protein
MARALGSDRINSLVRPLQLASKKLVEAPQTFRQILTASAISDQTSDRKALGTLERIVGHRVNLWLNRRVGTPLHFHMRRDVKAETGSKSATIKLDEGLALANHRHTASAPYPSNSLCEAPNGRDPPKSIYLFAATIAQCRRSGEIAGGKFIGQDFFPIKLHGRLGQMMCSRAGSRSGTVSRPNDYVLRHFTSAGLAPSQPLQHALRLGIIIRKGECDAAADRIGRLFQVERQTRPLLRSPVFNQPLVEDAPVSRKLSPRAFKTSTFGFPPVKHQ